MDIVAAEEEITIWKVVVEEEADAGKVVGKDFLAQVLTIIEEIYLKFILQVSIIFSLFNWISILVFL